MWIECRHGFLLFDESSPGQISRAMQLWKLSIESSPYGYTLSALASAPRFSIKGTPYLGAIATADFAGDPWDVMRANGLVYDLAIGGLVPIELVTWRVKLENQGSYFVASGLIPPGALTDEGLRVTDYAAWYSFDTGRFRYSEVTRV